MLKLDKVKRIFDNGKTAFEPLSFEAQNKEIIGILGTSGCGKSSLLRVIAGLDGHEEGNISIDDQTVSGMNEKIGVIFQEARLMPWLNVVENVAFGLKGQKKENLERAKQFIKLVGLEGFEKHYPKELSGGMSQRVAIARSLVTSPSILLLDEPFSALDAFTKMQLQDLLLQVWKTCKSTMLLVTHDIDEALYLCDKLIVMRGQPGEIIDIISVAEPRPRSRGNEALARQKEQILKLLHLTSDEIEEEKHDVSIRKPHTAAPKGASLTRLPESG
ncbi:ABC transporter ATP-binding protein [Paenibacillus sp. IITD108]|uniref:ABC transporter ATP-binding protein n=1 Tax=Paenibacillus sp. IITD108 TaxID=3116649 RepID=UPI002F409F50